MNGWIDDALSHLLNHERGKMEEANYCSWQFSAQFDCNLQNIIQTIIILWAWKMCINAGMECWR